MARRPEYVTEQRATINLMARRPDATNSVGRAAEVVPRRRLAPEQLHRADASRPGSAKVRDLKGVRPTHDTKPDELVARKRGSRSWGWVKRQSPHDGLQTRELAPSQRCHIYSRRPFGVENGPACGPHRERRVLYRRRLRALAISRPKLEHGPAPRDAPGLLEALQVRGDLHEPKRFLGPFRQPAMSRSADRTSPYSTKPNSRSSTRSCSALQGSAARRSARRPTAISSAGNWSASTMKSHIAPPCSATKRRRMRFWPAAAKP